MPQEDVGAEGQGVHVLSANGVNFALFHLYGKNKLLKQYVVLTSVTHWHTCSLVAQAVGNVAVMFFVTFARFPRAQANNRGKVFNCRDANLYRISLAR